MIADSVPAELDPKTCADGNGNGNGSGRLTAVEVARPRDIDDLCQQFVLVCESAVDPMEICSALEFDGLNDQTARQRYGVSDVFALAEEMYRRVPRRPAEPEPPTDPWQGSKLRPALHGLLYGLPTVCFPAAAGLLAGPRVLSVLIIALLASWSLSQALAYLGYARLGRGDSAEAARLLLAGMTVGFAGMTLAMAATGLVAHARVSGLIFGLGLGAYMLGATVLMVFGAERLLLIVLAPGVLGSIAFLLLGRPAHLEYTAWAALAATPLLALGLASVRADREADFRGLRGRRNRRNRRSRRGRRGRRRVRGVSGLRFLRGARRSRHAQSSPAAGRLFVASELRGALPSAGFGLVAAGLLVLPVAAGLPGHRGPNTGALLASLPLALSMGGAESALIWFRRRTQRLLRSTRSLPAFAARARLALFAALLQYLTAAVLLTAAVIAVASATRLIHPHWAVVPEIAAYLALGGAMFLALLLQAFGSRTFPLIACVVTLAFELLWRDLGVLGQIVACTELLVVLAGYAVLMLGKAVLHAF
jgi:ABC-type multidrug transport system fused ATPase/permease subunit